MAQTLEVVLNCFPSSLKASLANFLALTHAQLSLSLPTYHSAFLSSTSDFIAPTSDDEDSSTVPSDLPGFIGTVFDFLAQAVRMKGAKKLYVESKRPTDLMLAGMESVMAFAGMTTDDEDEWATNPNAFVADEDDEAATYNVRAAATDFAIVSARASHPAALSQNGR